MMQYKSVYYTLKKLVVITVHTLKININDPEPFILEPTVTETGGQVCCVVC